ncbi:hypothetical protein Fcan01_00711 [Folsomia candida]|uniref:MACPF domain-containing protein n=1 Tax=Folsomia candida TaxID=158441 RepID=A0A226EWU2_FOLCA|nr:hypothetical protein Fcan01_00711 [Folsomia candida]
MDPILMRKFPNSLPYLQKALNLRHIRSEEDIPKTKLGILQLMKYLRSNEAILFLLEDALKISPPAFPLNVIAGHSFHVFKDLPLSRTPLLLGEPTSSDIGYLFPSILTCSVEKKLGISGKIGADRFTGEIRPGFNIESESFTDSGCVITAVREIRMFELVLNDKPALSDAFKKILLQLPVYNETDHDNVNVWVNFFENYGTHVVRSVYGGGAIEITLRSSKKCETSAITNALFNVIQFAEDLVSIKGLSSGNSTSGLVVRDGISHQLKFRGGDAKYHTTDLTKMNLDEASTLLADWKNSLQLNPTILTTEMGLVPIGEIAKKVGTRQNITAAVATATSLYFHSDLKYKPKPVNQVIQGDRDSVLPVQSNQGFTAIIQMMLNQTAESNKRFELMMTKFETDRRLQEERRANETREQRAWERHQQEFQYNMSRLEQNERRTQEAARQQKLLDMMNATAAAEQNWRAEQARQQAAINSARAAQQQRDHDLMVAIINKPQPPPSSCLRRGTLIHAGEVFKPVESLQVGDIILDHNINPTTVVGISYEFLQSQGFHGFDNETFFFTESHILAGPANNNDSGLQFYVKDKPLLLRQNPLMEFIPVQEMQYREPFQVLKLDPKNATSLGSATVQVYTDPSPHSEDELIYFLQVDNPSGTYIANGYVCRHETPPLDKWPHAMGVLFKIFYTEELAFFGDVPYTMEVMEKIDLITAEVEEALVKVDLKRLISSAGDDDGSIELPFDPEEATTVLQGVFNNPTLGAMATKLYAATSKKLSLYFDDENAQEFVGHGFIGRGQDLIFKEIHAQFVTSVRKYFDFSTE